MAREFDGSIPEYLQRDAAPVATTPLSLACWHYNTDTTKGQYVLWVGDKDVTDNWFCLFANTGSQGPDAFAYDGTQGRARASAGESANTWHHLCGTFTTSTSRAMYIDGGSKGTNATNVTPAGTDRVTIGQSGDDTPSAPVYGRVAEAAVWNIILPDDVVAALAKGYSPLLFLEGLVAYWPLIRDEDQDRVGGYDLTAYNSPGIAAHPRVFYPAPPRIIAIPGGEDLEKALADSVSIADSPANAIGMVEADSVAMADAAIRAVGLSPSDSVALADTIAKAVASVLSDTVTLADARAASTGKALSDSIAVADAIAALRGLFLSDSVEVGDALAKAIATAHGDSITVADLFATDWVQLVILAALFASSMTLRATYARPIALASTYAPAMSLAATYHGGGAA